MEHDPGSRQIHDKCEHAFSTEYKRLVNCKHGSSSFYPHIQGRRNRGADGGGEDVTPAFDIFLCFSHCLNIFSKPLVPMICQCLSPSPPPPPHSQSRSYVSNIYCKHYFHFLFLYRYVTFLPVCVLLRLGKA